MEDIKFKCEECGKEFDPDPDTMRELHIGSELVPEEDTTISELPSPEELSSMSEFHLSELGLTTDDRDKLLRGEDVVVGAICVCKECQDRLASESSIDNPPSTY